MRKLIVIACLVALTIAASAQPPQAPQPATPPSAAPEGPVKAGDLTLESNLDKASYAIGLDFGRTFTKANMQLNFDAMKQGFADAAAGTAAMTNEQMAAIMTEFQREMVAKMQESQAQYLAEKETEEGVKKTESGLLYKVIEEGEGASPKATDRVRVEYTGKLSDGTVFDSSEKQGGPVEFEVGRVIPGWTEALQMMKPGDHWTLYIPADLAYGPRGNRGIPPNSTLEFDVKLIEVIEKPANEVTIPQSSPSAQ